MLVEELPEERIADLSEKSGSEGKVADYEVKNLLGDC
jgi:hypothetical protein